LLKPSVRSIIYDCKIDPFCGRLDFILFLSFIEEIKGKAIPLHAETGPEGSKRLRFPDFETVGT
jgi:hypothetical protein